MQIVVLASFPINDLKEFVSNLESRKNQLDKV